MYQSKSINKSINQWINCNYNSNNNNNKNIILIYNINNNNNNSNENIYLNAFNVYAFASSFFFE